jgi:hypothetical protein
MKILRQRTHFTKTIWKMSKIESKVIGNYDVEKGKCETVYEEDTTYKDLAVIARIIWNL